MRTANRQILIRVSEQEYSALTGAASKIGLSVPKLVKSRVLKIRDIEPKFTHAEATQIQIAIRKIGVNVNQIARGVNQGFDNPDLAGIRKALEVIWQQLN